MLMVDTAIYDGIMPQCMVLVAMLAVKDRIAQELNIIGDGMCSEVGECISGAQLLHVHGAMSHDVAHQIDIAEVAHNIEFAFAPSLNLIHEATTEIFHEFQACVVGIDA